MNIDDLILVSVDDHVVEPPDMFSGHIPARYADQAPRVITRECGTYPGRMIPLALPPIWDAGLMAEEVRRMARKGCHAVTFSENPEKLGYPSFHNDHWDPFWTACSDENTVVCLHIGSSSQVVVTSIEAPIDTLITLQPINIVQAAADLLRSPALRKFPRLTVALSDGGVGWIPYFLEPLDRLYTSHRAC